MRLKQLLLLSLIILIFSCTPKEEEKRVPQENAAADISSSEADPASVLTLTKNNSTNSDNQNDDGLKDDGKKNEATGGSGLLWSPFSGPLYLQSIKPAAYILPESLMIGPLSDPLSYTLAEREAYSLVADFWDSFRMGRIPRELISKKAHPLFLEEMDQYIDKGSEVVDFYPGSFKYSGISASIKLVLLSETGYIKAVMYMDNENGVWSLTDWEIPFRYWPGEPVPREKDFMQRRIVY